MDALGIKSIICFHVKQLVDPSQKKKFLGVLYANPHLPHIFSAGVMPTVRE
jgi:hypothetical protein